MRNIISTIIVVLSIFITPLIVCAKTIDDVLSNLNRQASCAYNIDYKVSQPFSDADIEYSVMLYSTKSIGDTLSKSNYRIQYSTPRGERGFVSYYDGNLFQFDNNRLREYHWELDSVPFMSQFNGGVQSQGLFVSLLPTSIEREIMKLKCDSNNVVRFIRDTIVNQSKVDAIEIFEYKKGVVLRELIYSFNKSTGNIERIDIENNPGTIGEQSVVAKYSVLPFYKRDSTFYSEAGLLKDYPTEFEKYRVSNFTIENLPGRKVPDFYLPTTTGERYTWDGGFNNPTIIAFLDSNGGMTLNTIKEIRQAVEQMPITADVLWIFTGNNLDDIWELMPNTLQNERSLISGNKFSTKCGVTGFPTLLFVGRDGVVRDVILGLNKDMKNIVIQKMALM